MIPPNQNSGNTDRSQSLLYMLSGILFVLVLLEKSMTAPKVSLPDLPDFSQIPTIQEEALHSIPARTKERLGFKNTGKESIPVLDAKDSPSPSLSNTNTYGNQSDPWEEISDVDWERSAQRDIDELIPHTDVPVLDSSSNQLNVDSHINLYFIKFFGRDSKASSRLLKVPRILPTGKDPIHFILDELKKGPRPEESSKGVLNALPLSFTYNKNYKIQDGILFLDLGSEFEFGGGPQVIQDRLDQVAHSLVGVGGIRGVKITIDRKKVSTLGGDGIPLPDILGKRERRITTL